MKTANLESDAFVFFGATSVHEYEPGSWGPVQAEQIVARDGGWHNPEPIAEKTLVAKQ